MKYLLKLTLFEVGTLLKKTPLAPTAITPEEIASEKRWADLFERSQFLRAQMADEALEEDRAGKTLPITCVTEAMGDVD